jgi:hypothetical protein
MSLTTLTKVNASQLDTASFVLNSLSDVDLTIPPSVGQTIIWNGTQFVAGASFSASDFDTAFAAKSTSNLTEGSNLYFTTARARDAVSATGSILYNSTTGVFSFAQGNTDTVSEGTTNKYYTDMRARAAISVSGDLVYNSATGVVSYTHGNTDTVSEGVTNKYYTDARARSAISAGTGITYSSSSGVISIGQDISTTANPSFTNLTITGTLTVTGTTTTVSSTNLEITDSLLYVAKGNTANANDIGFVGHFNDGTYQHTGLVRDASDGKWKIFSHVLTEPSDTIDFTSATYDTLKVGTIETNAIAGVTTDALSEGTTNKYYTDVRARAAISAGSNVTYSSATGVISLTSGNVTGALGFTPYNATNPSGYTTNVGTVTSVGGTGTVNGLTLTGTVTTSGSLTLGGTLNLSSPPAIGNTTASTGAFTTLSASSAIYGATTLAIGISAPSTTGGTAVAHIAGGTLKLDNSAKLQWDGIYPSYISGTSGSSGQILIQPGNNGSAMTVNPSGTASTNTTTGAAVITGGVGVSGNLNVGSQGTFSGHVTVSNAYLKVSPGYGIFDTGGTASNSLLFYADSTRITNNGVDKFLVYNSGIVSITTTTAATSTSTGALQVSGGVGIAGALYVGSSIIGASASITGTTSTGVLQVGYTTTPVGKFSVVSAPSTGVGSTTAWTSGHSVFGPNAGSTTGAALALGYNTTLDVSEIYSLAPNSAWKAINLYGSNVNLYAGGSPAIVAAVSSTGIAVTGMVTASGLIQAGTAGFQSATYTAGARNRIWSFGNADGYGVSYFQGTAGLGSLDTIGLHFGTATSAASQFQFVSNGNMYATGDVYSAYSDINLKTIVGRIENPIQQLMQIETFYYEPNELALSMGVAPGRKVGLSAQGLLKVQPEVVSTRPDGFLTAQYERLVPLLIESIKKHEEVIQAQQAQINILKEKLGII